MTTPVIRVEFVSNATFLWLTRWNAGLQSVIMVAGYARAYAMSGTRKLAAILCSDVVGYSRLAGADEDRILARLRALRSDLIDPTIAVHNGRVVKRTGDGSIVEFRSAVDAVRCAIEVQTAMVERNAGVPEDRQIIFRIGIHVGDVVEESDGDLMGDGVNIAARLEGIAKPGAICLSEDAYRQVKGRVDLSVTDLGPTQLKNIAEPIRAYSLQVGGTAKRAQAPQIQPAAVANPRGLLRRWPAVASLLLVAALVAGVYAWRSGLASRMVGITMVEDKLATAPRLSIVVLPFENLSSATADPHCRSAKRTHAFDECARVRRAEGPRRRRSFCPPARCRLRDRRSIDRPRDRPKHSLGAPLTDRDRRAYLGRPLRRRAQQARALQVEFISPCHGVELVKVEALLSHANGRATPTRSISPCKPRTYGICLTQAIYRRRTRRSAHLLWPFACGTQRFDALTINSSTPRELARRETTTPPGSFSSPSLLRSPSKRGRPRICAPVSVEMQLGVDHDRALGRRGRSEDGFAGHRNGVAVEPARSECPLVAILYVRPPRGPCALGTSDRMVQQVSRGPTAGLVSARRPRLRQRLGRPRQGGQAGRRPIAESLSRLHRADLGRHPTGPTIRPSTRKISASSTACARRACRKATRRTEPARPCPVCVENFFCGPAVVSDGQGEG